MTGDGGRSEQRGQELTKHDNLCLARCWTCHTLVFIALLVSFQRHSSSSVQADDACRAGLESIRHRGAHKPGL